MHFPLKIQKKLVSKHTPFTLFLDKLNVECCAYALRGSTDSCLGAVQPLGCILSSAQPKDAVKTLEILNCDNHPKIPLSFL
jgi:hypothetical protein